jgi:OmpA-OmpF porin, OOP family
MIGYIAFRKKQAKSKALKRIKRFYYFFLHLKIKKCYKQIFLPLLLYSFAFGSVVAQIETDKLLKRAKNKTEKKVERRVNKQMGKTLDNIVDAIDGKGKSEDTKSPAAESQARSVHESEKEEERAGGDPVSAPQEVVKIPELVWSRFDFVPGDVIIFKDNLEGERNGEFPGK